MSQYCTIKTQFKNETALVVALMETGNWERSQIEIHQEPQNLVGFQEDVRDDKAHIIIRRAHVGRNSNDIGFRRTSTGEYEAIISEFDKSKYGEQWNKQLKGNYAFHILKQRQSARGRMVQRERLENGRQRVTIGGYR